MSTRRISTPKFLTVLILTFLLTLTGVLGSLAGLGSRLWNDAVYIRTENAFRESQLQKVHDVVDSLAATYHFEAQPIHDMVSPESFSEYGMRVRDWVRALVSEEEPDLDMPMYFLPDIETVIRHDPGFLENVPSSQQRSVAQNDVEGVIESTAQQQIVPLRSQLIALGRQMAVERIRLSMIPELLGKAWYLIPAALVLCLLILLCVRHALRYALAFFGSALAACGIMNLLGAVLVWLLRLPQLVTAVNTDFAAVFTYWLRILGLPFILGGACALLAGYVMICVYMRVQSGKAGSKPA